MEEKKIVITATHVVKVTSALGFIVALFLIITNIFSIIELSNPVTLILYLVIVNCFLGIALNFNKNKKE